MGNLTLNEMKRAILKAAAAAPPNGVHKINLVGRPYQPGTLEQQLSVQFDPDERALAARAFDELRSVGHIRPTFTDLVDPESWVEITASGRIALSTEKFESPIIREREQKFRILWSPGQAERDFKIWADEDRAAGRPIAVLFLDIDHFKALNTTYTETIVDETILRPFQQLLRDLSSHRGEAYLHGNGDEHLVLLRNCGPKEAVEFAERLRAQVGTALFGVGNEPVRVTVSIGVGTFPADGETYLDVLGAANRAENEAKATRNVVRLARSSRSVETAERRGTPPLASSEEIEKLIEWFEKSNPHVRRDAAGELLTLIYKKRVFQYEPVRAAIRRLMKDLDEEVRLKALEIHTALMRWERESVGRYYAQPLIAVAERDESPRVRNFAMAAIGATGDTYYCEWIYVWITGWSEEAFRQAYPISALIGLASSGLREKIRNDLRSLMEQSYDPTVGARLVEALKAVSNQ